MHSLQNYVSIFALFIGTILGKNLVTSHEDFGYQGNKGPLHWADGLNYGSCAGKLQSPIDIEEHKVKPVRLPPLIFSGFHLVPKSMVLTNNGHTVKLEIKTSTLATLSGGPLNGPYVFSQLHFHWGPNDSVGSEDRINNHSFPMELHMVFYKMEYGDVDTATKFKDGLCVLAVFYDAYDFDNSVYSEIVEHLHSVTHPHSKKSLRAPVTLDDLLPSNKHHYYTYNGSLTTPPCYEVVTWLDFKEPIPLSHFQDGRVFTSQEALNSSQVKVLKARGMEESLAVADFAIGLISMPLFTVSTILGYWPLGRHICDTWLALDYLASNASVLNLLIISFDRYFSVTRPLTYRAKRTTTRAAIMIACAWGISLLLWPPWIYAWPYIEGKRTVPETECYIQFIETNHYITFGTAIAAFYLPVTVMCVLYYRIWRETKKRQKDLPNLQANTKTSSKRSNSREENGPDGRVRYGSDYDLYRFGEGFRKKPPLFSYARIRNWCVSWWYSGRMEEEFDTASEMGIHIRDPYVIRYPSSAAQRSPQSGSTTPHSGPTTPRSGPTTPRSGPTTPRSGPTTPRSPRPGPSQESRSDPTTPQPTKITTTADIERAPSDESIYTILIRIPKDPIGPDGEATKPSIKMIENTIPAVVRKHAGIPPPKPVEKKDQGTSTYDDILPYPTSSLPRRRPSSLPERIPYKAPKSIIKVRGKKKKKAQEKKQDKKAAKTLTAILLSFIITWTPYNVLVLLKPVTTGYTCIPRQLWDFFYYLCYINSTINPVCYALCNASFRRTYVRILTCKWQSRKRVGVNRGLFNT